MKPILSIVIPSYQNDIALRQVIENILTVCASQELEEDVEVYVEAHSCSKFKENYLKNIKAKNFRYRSTKEYFEFDENIERSLLNSKGEYIWLLGDEENITSIGLAEIMSVIRKDKSLNVIVVGAQEIKSTSDWNQVTYANEKTQSFNNLSDFGKSLSKRIGFISCLIFNREALETKDMIPEKVKNIGFYHIALLLTYLRSCKNMDSIFIPHPCFSYIKDIREKDPKFIKDRLIVNAFSYKKVYEETLPKHVSGIFIENIIIRFVPYIFKDKLNKPSIKIYLKIFNQYRSYLKSYTYILPVIIFPTFLLKILQKIINFIRMINNWVL